MIDDVSERKYAVLMETSGEECESWYYCILYNGNEENLQYLQSQIEPVKWRVDDGLSTFDLDLDHLISETTAKQLTKLELNHCFFHRKFDGVLQKIELGFKSGDKNKRKIKKAFEILGYGRIEDFIDGEDIDEEDMVDPNEVHFSSEEGSEESSSDDSSEEDEDDKDSSIEDFKRLKLSESSIPEESRRSNRPSDKELESIREKQRSMRELESRREAEKLERESRREAERESRRELESRREDRRDAESKRNAPPSSRRDESRRDESRRDESRRDAPPSRRDESRRELESRRFDESSLPSALRKKHN